MQSREFSNNIKSYEPSFHFIGSISKYGHLAVLTYWDSTPAKRYLGGKKTQNKNLKAVIRSSVDELLDAWVDILTYSVRGRGGQNKDFSQDLGICRK